MRIWALCIIVCVLFAGCGADDSFSDLIHEFRGKRDAYGVLEEICRSLMRETEIRGFISGALDSEDHLVLTGNRTVLFRSYKVRRHQSDSALMELKTIARKLRVDSVHMYDDDDAVWIIRSSGGVLGSSVGYISACDTSFISEVDGYQPIPGEACWFVFFD